VTIGKVTILRADGVGASINYIIYNWTVQRNITVIIALTRLIFV